MLRFAAAVACAALTVVPAMASLSPKVTHSGNIRLSVDGAGTTSSSRTIRADKPSAAATVKAAYLIAVSTGSSGRTISPGQIRLAGTPISFTDSVPSAINSWNYWTEVTSLVRPTLNAAGPGITEFTLEEDYSGDIDGEVLAVIWNEPSAAPTTITLMFGAQNTLGDSFTVTLAQPIDKTNPRTVLDMSLGISYGYQSGSCQYSILEMAVNGRRISTSAGGQDDGESSNGALITAGGIGDSNQNPPDPYFMNCNDPRYDDELYNLLTFVDNGATSFTVSTRNPSNDDNIFFAAIVLGANTAVVGEGILVSNTTGSAPTGSSQTVAALVQTSTGVPVGGRSVTCRVVSGPNLGTSKTASTNSSGVATTTFTSTVAGTDSIQCSMSNSQNQTQLSNLVTRTWTGTSNLAYSLVLTPDGATYPVGKTHTLSAKLWTGTSAPVSNASVEFEIVSGPNKNTLGSAATSIFGIATKQYRSSVTGEDTIRASVLINGVKYVSNFVKVAWTNSGAPRITLTPVSSTNPVMGQQTVTATLYDALGNLVPGADVTFTVTSGPNTGSLGIQKSSFAGIATRTWSSSSTGNDTVQAKATINGTLVTSNNANISWNGLLCDVDSNGQIDNRDTAAVFAARNQLVLPGDVRDADFDGSITAMDVRKCTLMCTKPNCVQ